MRKHKKGFTIVELVIVIAVIAVLTAVLVPTFIHLSSKAKDSVDKTVVKNANIQLAAKEAVEGKNRCMSDAVKDVDEIGYHIPGVATGNGNYIVWDRTTDRFVLMNSDHEPILSEGSVSENKIDLFKPVNSLDESERGGYSVYINNKTLVTPESEVSIAGFGFDAGELCEVESSNHTKYTLKVGDSNKDILVATNSVDTKLVVNAPNGSVKHTGIVGETTITAVKDASYHEAGRVGFAEMGTGRYVAESSANVKALWFSNGEATYSKVSGAVVTEYATNAATRSALDIEGVVREDIIVDADEDTIKRDAIDEIKREVTPQPSDPYAALVAQIESDPRAATAVYASVCQGETEYFYDGLPESIGGKTINIIMLKADQAPFIFVASSNIVFDVNGHIVTFDGDGIGAATGTTMTLIDSKGTGRFITEAIDPYDSTIICESGYFEVGMFGNPFLGVAGTIIINGGTFTINPSSYVGQGHSVVKEGNVWVVS